MAADWDYFDPYRLNVDIINKFLMEIFGDKDFQTQVFCLVYPLRFDTDS